MEVKLGIVDNPRELVVDTDQPADEVADAITKAVGQPHGLLWLTDVKGRRVGVPAGKLAYVEFGEQDANRRVGFGR